MDGGVLNADEYVCLSAKAKTETADEINRRLTDCISRKGVVLRRKFMDLLAKHQPHPPSPGNRISTNGNRVEAHVLDSQVFPGTW